MRRKYRLKNHRTLKVEQFRMKRYSQRYHKTLEERLGRKKTIGNS
jgi:hypothetical protein